MNDSKLIQFLKTVDATELKALGNFLKDAKGANDVNKLFSYLKNHHPEYAEEKVKKLLVSNKVFSDSKNSKKKLENTMVKFVKLLDDFFIQQELKRETIDRDFLYLKALRRRKLDNHFFRKADEVKKQWHKSPPAGLEHLHNEYKLNRMYFTHPGFSLNREAPKGLDVLINSIDNYYFSIKLFWSLVFVNNGNFFDSLNKNTKSKRLLSEILNLCNTKEFEVSPQFKLLSDLLNLFLKRNFDTISSLKDLFIKQINFYDEKERSYVITTLEAGFFQNSNSGSEDVIQNLFELNCLRIEQNCILEGGYITYNRFTNVLNIGFAAKQLNWTENFIQKYIQYLPDEIKEDTLKISNANLKFQKSAYKEALHLLVDLRYKNELFSLYGRSIQLQSSYELNDYDLFFSFTNAFSLYLSRNDRFASNTIEQFLNFINFSKRLFRLKLNFNISDYNKLKLDLTSQSNIAYKSWLTEKIKEINE